VSDISKREHVEQQLDALLGVTSGDEAYSIIDTAFTPPDVDGEALATWHYHAERTRRQLVGAALGELTAGATIERLSDHFDQHGTVAIASAKEHPVRSHSLQDLVATLQHWFSEPMPDVIQTNSTAQALVEAGNQRRPQFYNAVKNWLVYRHAKGLNLNWELPSLDADIGKDIAGAFEMNLSNETATQYLIFGLDPFRSGSRPAALAQQRIPQFPKFTSTVHEISAPVQGPFVTYDPELNVYEDNKDKGTPQVLYSAWERDPTPENARAFLALARDDEIGHNLRTMASFPGTGSDGRARNPGHCHIDMRIQREEAFPVSPREFLARLGQTSLATTQYLNLSTLVAGVGLDAAKNRVYGNWPALTP